jgi:predicted nucleic acid-binding protein
MVAVFADTYFYLALLGRDDAARSRAEEVAAAISAPVITTAWVLVEVANALAAPEYRRFSLQLVQSLRADPAVTLVPAAQQLFERGEALYADRPDKGWSLTDCISFLVMQDMNVSGALTADHHFEQAGFTVLLKPR